MYDFDLLIASRNQGKLREFREILSPYFKRIVLPEHLGFDYDVPETGATFEENARLKAGFLFERFPGYAVLADDSGLIVDALGGAPGVYSARYAGEKAEFEDNIDKLLENMRGIKDRSARFYCALTLILPACCARGDAAETEGGKSGGTVAGAAESPAASKTLTVSGTTEGRILKKRDGANGFGYDCVFFSNDLRMSFGRAGEAEKNEVSHRSRALKKLFSALDGC